MPKFRVNPSMPAKQICTEFRNAQGDVLVLIPGSTVELSADLSAKVMEAYPGKLIISGEDSKESKEAAKDGKAKGPGENVPNVVTK